jgi:hypothetical protein
MARRLLHRWPPKRFGAAHMKTIKDFKALKDIKYLKQYQEGKIGYIFAWLLGVPIPVLFLIFLLRGCN